MSEPSSESSPTPRPLVQVENLTMRFGDQTVLRNLSFTVPKGQTLAIIGESGCGKTVLLKSLIGLLRPVQGRVAFDGHQLPEMRAHDLARLRLRIGYVFQNAALFDSLTIGQNVAFPLREHTHHGDAEIARRVRDNLAQVGLPEEVIPKKPAELSGGMRKRVGLARALIMDPELVLYDEPTTGLDPIMSDVINELMMRTRHLHDVTSVMVTHDMRSARKVADRVIMLYPNARLDPDEPQILFDGPPSQLDRATDRRVGQFVRGEAGERLVEMGEQRS